MGRIVRAPRVALIGSRGVPASYGGYETLMEELGARLVERGFEVTVYCRAHHTDPTLKSYRGMRLVVLPTLKSKYLDTPVHSLLSVLHAGSLPYDAALMVNSANALFVPLLRAGAIPTALNVDGIEKRRAKWGWPGRMVYALSERLSTVVADALVTDAEVIAGHYRRRYAVESETIAYGVDPAPEPPGPTLAGLGLEPRRYFLYVSRFEPENNPHRVVESYRRVGGEIPLVGSSAALPKTPTRACVSRVRSTAGAIANCSPMRWPTSRRPRSAAHIQRWSRPWATGRRWWSMTRRNTVKWPATVPSTSASLSRETWRRRWRACEPPPRRRWPTVGGVPREPVSYTTGMAWPTATRRCYGASPA